MNASELPSLPLFNIQKRPKTTIDTLTLKEIFEGIPEEVKEYARVLLKNEWKIRVTEQTRGWCLNKERNITLPLWMFKKDMTFRTWYISHELAHGFDKCKHLHGPEFMEWLKKWNLLTSPEHFEDPQLSKVESL